MNFDGALSDIDTDAKILSWISNNITKTSFTSFEVAQSELETVQSLSRAAVDNNIAFYRALDGETPERIIEVIGTPDPPIVSTARPTCVKALNKSISTLTSQFAGEVAGAVALLPNNGATASLTIAKANQVFMIGVQMAAEEFIKCCVG